MRFGAHLPLIDFDGAGPPELCRYVEVAAESGFGAISANDHLVYQRPWLDGVVALASVVGCSADLTLATTVALPVVRGPIALAKAAAALDVLSEGRLVLGVGPGSSAADHGAVRVSFDERWPRFDEAVRVLRAELATGPAPATSRFYDAPRLDPSPNRPVPIWVGSWGSAAGLRRVARLGDGWLASAYNTTPEQPGAARDGLHEALAASGREVRGFPVALASMWTYLTESDSEALARLEVLARMLGREPDALRRQVFIGGADECAAKLNRYAEAGVDTVFIWPVDEPLVQLRRFGTDVVPQLA